MKHPSNRAFTMFFAVLISGLALAIGVAIYDLTVRQLALSGTTLQSQYAIYAADSGAECALYWDNQCTTSACNCLTRDSNGRCTAGSAFATSTSFGGAPNNSGLSCSSFDITNPDTTSVNYLVTKTATAATTTFQFIVSGGIYCSDVTVAKWTASGVQNTAVTSNGYNTCDTTATNRVQRTLRLNY